MNKCSIGVREERSLSGRVSKKKMKFSIPPKVHSWAHMSSLQGVKAQELTIFHEFTTTGVAITYPGPKEGHFAHQGETIGTRPAWTLSEFPQKFQHFTQSNGQMFFIWHCQYIKEHVRTLGNIYLSCYTMCFVVGLGQGSHICKLDSFYTAWHVNVAGSQRSLFTHVRDGHGAVSKRVLCGFGSWTENRSCTYVNPALK